MALYPCRRPTGARHPRGHPPGFSERFYRSRSQLGWMRGGGQSRHHGLGLAIFPAASPICSGVTSSEWYQRTGPWQQSLKPQFCDDKGEQVPGPGLAKPCSAPCRAGDVSPRKTPPRRGGRNPQPAAVSEAVQLQKTRASKPMPWRAAKAPWKNAAARTFDAIPPRWTCRCPGMDGSGDAPEPSVPTKKIHRPHHRRSSPLRRLKRRKTAKSSAWPSTRGMDDYPVAEVP